MKQNQWRKTSVLISSVAATMVIIACSGADDRNQFQNDEEQNANSDSNASSGQGGATAVSVVTTGSGNSGAADGGPTSGVTSGGTDSSSSGSTTSGGGETCSESPCKVTSPQCGCSNDQKCTLDEQGLRTCEADGSVKAGESCDGPTCEAGTMCLGSSLFANCKSFCDSDSDCSGAGSLCVVKLGDGQGGALQETWCTDDCDPVTNSGCPASGKCVMFREPNPPNRIFTDCWQAGTGTQNESCVYDDDCAAGYACIDHNGGICSHWCEVANPSCPGGTICHSFGTPALVGGVEYGACV